jgi:hypothetical protein
MIYKIRELYEYYNFSNWSLDWFTMVYKLHGSKVGYSETVC